MRRMQLAATCAATSTWRAMVLCWRWRAICNAGASPKNAAASTIATAVKARTRQSGVALNHRGVLGAVSSKTNHETAESETGKPTKRRRAEGSR